MIGQHREPHNAVRLHQGCLLETDASNFIHSVCLPTFKDRAGGLPVVQRGVSGEPQVASTDVVSTVAEEREAAAPVPCYFYIAYLKPLENGDGGNVLRRRGAQATGIFCVVLDDLGTKSKPASELPLAPSWVMETSPGNYQAGYILSRLIPPERFREFSAFMTHLGAAGFTDPGAKDAVRLMRIPGSPNTKETLDEVFYS